MARENEIIGYEKFLSKDKKRECLKVSVVRPLTKFDKDHGRVGMKVEAEWIPEELQPLFDESVIGCILECEYEKSGNFLNVIDVNFKD